MCYNIFSIVYQNLTSSISRTMLMSIFILIMSYFIWRVCKFLYVAAISPSGVQYVNFKRQSLSMTSNYNPFIFEVDYKTASYSGIKCILKSEYTCYVQALWRVPISPLFDLLHGDWKSLINALVTHIPAEKFSSKCIFANDLFVLHAGEEKSIEFKPYLHPNNENALFQEATNLREMYPFVVLMVLRERDYVPESFVIAMASAIHVPDQYLSLYPQLIGQYTKLFSGHVGQVKNIYLSSPASSDDGVSRHDLCLICYHRPVSMVFLPCRHACLCSVCFELCDRCPVCRASSPYCFELPGIRAGNY